MLRFRLFGVPVHVQPVFWITALLLGGGIQQPGLLVLWIAIVFVSILIHELGHVAAMRYAGGSAQIVLTAFGGAAIPDVPSKHPMLMSVLISAAGPLAQLALGALIAVAVAALGGVVGMRTGSMGVPYLAALLPGASPYVNYGINFLLYISFFWSLLNLAPVIPLDGGQIARSLFGVRAAMILSLAAAVSIGLFAFMRGNTYLGLLFAWLTFSNVQMLLALRQQMAPRVSSE